MLAPGSNAEKKAYPNGVSEMKWENVNVSCYLHLIHNVLHMQLPTVPTIHERGNVFQKGSRCRAIPVIQFTDTMPYAEEL